MRVAILGMGPSRIKAPDKDWEFWGLAMDPMVQKFDRVFEMHRNSYWRHCEATLIEAKWKGHFKKLQSLGGKLVLRSADPDLPDAGVFNYAWAVQYRDYFTSSIAFILAHAIYINAQTVGVWGCDCLDDEHRPMRECLAFWCGVARGTGIEVVSPSGSSFLNHGLKPYGD